MLRRDEIVETQGQKWKEIGRQVKRYPAKTPPKHHCVACAVVSATNARNAPVVTFDADLLYYILPCAPYLRIGVLFPV